MAIGMLYSSYKKCQHRKETYYSYKNRWVVCLARVTPVIEFAKAISYIVIVVSIREYEDEVSSGTYKSKTDN